MRVYLLVLLLMTAGYAYSQAAVEGALLNSGGAGATAGAANALSGNLNQAFGRASGQVNGSQMIVVPAERRRPATSSTTGTKTPWRPVVSNTGGVPTATRPSNTAKPPAQTATNPPRKKSWEISTQR